jgi:predicted nucleotidyltransferase
MRRYYKSNQRIYKVDKEQVIEVVKRYSEVIQNIFSVKKVVLYGSYSRGDQKEWSDIDVAVFLNERKEDILTAESKLHKLRRDIDSRIEPVILDEEKDQSGFAKEVLKSGIIIFQSN